MTYRIRAFWCIAAALWVVSLFPPEVMASSYLSAEIETALLARAKFLQRADLTDNEFLSLETWLTARDINRFTNTLSHLSDTYNPWFYYINGFVANGNESDTYYNYAITAAAEDPGTLWLLALEFIRHDRFRWATGSFEALESHMFTGGGGASAPILAKQLILMGQAAAVQYPERANFCYTWAKHFDEEQVWWLYQKGLLNFPDNLMSVVPNFFTEVSHILSHSWRAQLGLAREAHRLISVAVFIFLCAVFLVFAVKYITSGVHPVGDLLFGSASPRFRIMSSVIIVLSVLLLGPIPAMWAVAFTVFRFLTPGEKKLFVTACILLILSPLNYYAESILLRSSVPDSAPVLLDRALREGYSEGLLEAIIEHSPKKTETLAKQLALAVSAAKGGDYARSKSALAVAARLAPQDPIFLMSAGNIAYLTGNIQDTERYYSELLKNRPKHAGAMYNLAQVHMNESGFMGSDMIAEAAKSDPALINGFMRENERHFSDGIPPLRKVIWPHITPKYFWGSLFFINPVEIFDFKILTLPKLHPLAVFCLFTLLFMALLTMNAFVWKETKVKKYFNCKICGRLLCRLCRKGMMCSVCYKTCVTSSHNAAAMHNLQLKHQTNAQMRKNFTRFIFGALIPGSHRLYNGEPVGTSALLLFLTCTIYAAYYCAFTFTTSYPDGTAINPLYCVSVLLIYNIIFIAKQCAWLSSALRVQAKMAGK